MIRLHKVCDEIAATVYAKVETYNPGHSIKDRMAMKMIKDAEETRQLLPGGTIIECTSGNTGAGQGTAICTKCRYVHYFRIVVICKWHGCDSCNFQLK